MLIKLVDTNTLQKVFKQYKMLDSLKCLVEELTEIVMCLIFFCVVTSFPLIDCKFFRLSRPSYYLGRRTKNEAE